MPTGSYSDYLANKILDHVTGGGDYARPATIYLAALKASDVEVTASGYARPAITNNATNFPASSARTKANATTLAFLAATADWSASGTDNIESIAAYDALTSGNQLWKVPMAGAYLDFTGAAATSLLTSAAHGLLNGQRVRVEAMPGLSLPTGLAASTTYYVVTSSTNTLQLAATQGGSAIALTGDGAGNIFLYKARPVFTGDTLSFAAGDLVLKHV